MKKQILIIKHGALGDIVQAFDSFYSIRVNFKDHKITLLTSSKFKKFMKLTNWFDNVIIDNRSGFWNFKEIYRIFKVLNNPWDKIIDLQCSKRTSFYYKFSNKNSNWYGIAKGCSHPMPNFDGVNNRDRMIIAAKMSGSKIFKAELNWLFNQKCKIQLPKKYCLFIPSCSPKKKSKRWNETNFIFLAKKLFDMDIIPCLIGSSDDEIVNNKILEKSSFCINLTNKTDFCDIAYLASNAIFILGNDTGPTFLAARTNKPTIMLMGKDTDEKMSAPYGDKCFWIKSDNINEIKKEKILKKIKKII